MSELSCKSCIPDAAFGQSGKVEIVFPGNVASGVHGMALNNGRLFVVARVSHGFAGQVAFAGLTEQGQVDPSFGQQGFVMAPFGKDHAAKPIEVIASAGGDFVVLAEDRSQSAGFPILGRYKPNGEPDRSFGEAGVVTLKLPGLLSNDEPFGLTELADGRLLVAITRFDHEANSVGLLVRLLADGSLDASFHDNGVFVFALNDASNLWFEGALQQQDGRVVVWGSTDAAGLLLRLGLDDLPDAGFGEGGCVRLTAPRGTQRASIEFYDVVEGEGGDLVVAGATDSRPYLAVVGRVTSTGQLDPSFNSGDVLVTAASSFGSRWVRSLQRDGRVTVCAGLTGIPYNERETEFLVGRLLADGQLDPGFGNGTGLKRTNIEAGADVAHCALSPDDQRLILGGTANVPGENSKAYLVCYFV
ncbi:delta-60 repeat domain-containing protein [Pseudomonas putida]|uniref:delta-60 repeat domain-containing protein n=1 Tax=Pseudomonas putida TaxID=303 RepID=UPI002271A0A5|nr:delta-60 repeat domain-containing protein [Pseudomonas putida]WAB95922.1 delta-60 repeat domain-containing protein [Pseudomonas putida]